MEFFHTTGMRMLRSGPLATSAEFIYKLHTVAYSREGNRDCRRGSSGSCHWGSPEDFLTSPYPQLHPLSPAHLDTHLHRAAHRPNLASLRAELSSSMTRRSEAMHAADKCGRAGQERRWGRGGTVAVVCDKDTAGEAGSTAGNGGWGRGRSRRGDRSLELSD